MDINEAVIEKIVRVVIETLQKNGMLKNGQERRDSGPSGDPGPGTTKEETRIPAAPKGRKTVITEETIRTCAKKNRTRVVVPKDSVITPSAKDAAKDKGIEILYE